MFILKFDGFDSTNSTKNHIRVSSGAFIYNVTIEYDDINSKRIISMKDVSSLPIKRNDCIIEMNNLQGFIVQDFVLFIQIDKEKKGMLNFKNWSTSSNLVLNTEKEYEIDIIHSDQILHFGKLSLINSGTKTVNKVEVMKWEFYDKENQKLSINDFELAVNNLDLNMGFIESQEKDKEIKELLEKLQNALSDVQKLNIALKSEQEEVKRLNKKYDDDMQAFQDDISDLQNNMAQLETQANEVIKQIQDSLDAADIKVKGLESDIESKKSEITQLKSDKVALDKKISELQTQLTNAAGTSDAAVQELRKQLADAQADVETKKKKIDELNTDIEAKKKTISELGGSLTIEQGKVTTLTGEKNQLIEDKNNLTKERDDLKTENGNLENKIREKDGQILVLNNQITQLLAGNISSSEKKTDRYILSEPLQKYSFGEAVGFSKGYSLSDRYNNVATKCFGTGVDIQSTINLRSFLNTNGQSKLDQFYNDFEKRFNIKKENIVLSENSTTQYNKRMIFNSGMYDSLESYGEDRRPILNEPYNCKNGIKIFDNQSFKQYNLSVFNIEKIDNLKYKITIQKGRQNECTVCGIGDNKEALSLDIGFAYQSNLSLFKDNYGNNHPKYEFIIENVTIKTDKRFIFDNIEKSEYTADGVNRFIEFEYDALKKPKATNYTKDIESYLLSDFPKLATIFESWIK